MLFFLWKTHELPGGSAPWIPTQGPHAAKLLSIAHFDFLHFAQALLNQRHCLLYWNQDFSICLKCLLAGKKKQHVFDLLLHCLPYPWQPYHYSNRWLYCPWSMTLCFLFKVWLQTKAPKPFVQKMICCCKQCDNIELFCVHQFTTVRLYISIYNLAYDIPVNNDRCGTESVGFSHSISSTSKEQRQSQNKLKQPGHRGRACWSGISCFMQKKKKKKKNILFVIC